MSQVNLHVLVLPGHETLQDLLERQAKMLAILEAQTQALREFVALSKEMKEKSIPKW